MARDQRWRQLRKSDRTWDSGLVPVGAGVLAGTLLALTVSAFDAPPIAVLWAFLFGLLAVALPIVAVQQGAARVRREVRALINVRPFTGDRLLAHDPWAMDALLAEQLIALLDEGPESVVELGSGHSTVIIARRLKERGHGRVVAVDHLAGFAGRTAEWLRNEGLAGHASVIHAPIDRREVEGRAVRWYAPGTLERALPDRIDLLVVDGPPNKLGRDVRWPAVPVLRDRLAPGAAILLDDGDRSDERRAAFDWHRRLGGRMRYLPGGKGRWLLRLPE